ncbi:uncharacterized protein LOC141614045 [Silene latifolia]|uniref:uncharacterized protein LOC141614045 n=1 Tax=Silene latifolia TaxID=37657 RepID=UPI003D775257
MFADDLLLFCKGNAHSVMLLMRAFSSFSDATGLNMNNTKSEIFFNGMDEVLQEDIKRVTGFCEGQMPFRYLGVPIQAGRLTKKECNSLTEKMVGRIRSLEAKKLSYAGRLTLINSVLNTLYSYWASMFIIPKSVIKRIEAICRNYLWDDSLEYHRVPLVAWDKVTLPKPEGGLGIKKAELWNVAPIGKLVNWVYSKADRLWIRWINQKNVCKVKELLKDGFTDDTWTAQTHGYSIRGGYDWLVMPHPILDWTKLVWNSWNTPKHSMITWITLHGGLNIKDKLFRIGCSNDNHCCCCDSMPETHEHLFIYCPYSSRIRGKLESWLGRPMPNVNDMVADNTGSIQWKIMAVVMNASRYNVRVSREIMQG